MLTHDILISDGFSYYADHDYYEKFLDCNSEQDYQIDNSFVTVTLLDGYLHSAFARAKCMTSVSIDRYVETIEDIEQLIKDFFEKKKDYEIKRSKTDH